MQRSVPLSVVRMAEGSAPVGHDDAGGATEGTTAGGPPPQGMKLKKFTDDHKLERALKKRLRQIEALVAMQDAGETLDASQVEKVARLKQVTRELRILEGKEVSEDEAESDDEEEGEGSEEEEEEESDDE